MILQALYDLAQRERLVEDPDFELVLVDFVLRVREDGSLAALVSLQDEKGKGQAMRVPRLPKRANGIVPGFLVDNAKYVLGLSKSASERDAQCHSAFRQHIRTAALADPDEGLLATNRFYERFEENTAQLFKFRPREEWSGDERLAFARDVDDQGRVHDRPRVRAYWAGLRALEAEEGEIGQCLVTGKTCVPARLHPNIKGVPNTSSTGAALVSFNLSSFETHSLSQGSNAPVSREVAEGYVTALNWMLGATPDRRRRSGIGVGSDSVMLVWTREQAPDFDFLLSLLDGPSSKEVMEAAVSPWKGLEPGDFDDTAFYALTLGGNVARVVLQDWFTSSLGEIKANLHRYFSDLALEAGESRPVPIRMLIDSLRPPGDEGKVPPDLAVRLFVSALRGFPFPRQILALALRRLRLPPSSKDITGNRYLRERVALIKATLIRMPRSGTSPERRIPVSLDETNQEVPYLLGRLFAVLERLQAVALNDLNASIRDRYFGSASCNPIVVFPRLLRLSMHHASKAERKGFWLEKLKGEIISALPTKAFPRVMTLEEQGLFAVGYYHQRETFFKASGSGESKETTVVRAADSQLSLLETLA